MKIQLLIATKDDDYAEHLSRQLSERYAEMFEVSVCSSERRLRELTDHRSFDEALLDVDLAEDVSLEGIRLPLLLWDGNASVDGQAAMLKVIRKYQRISTMAGQLLEQYALAFSGSGVLDEERARITAVWSPAGGTGKTTVALAFAAKKVAEGKKTVYLNLEHFSSVPIYFGECTRSISTAFDKLDSNLELLLQSIRQQDSGSGIYYFGPPENYDDINILTTEDMTRLITACACGSDELVLDLPSVCDERARDILDLAEQILLVVDASRTTQVKWKQFTSQNKVFENIREKAVLLANKGFRPDATAAVERTASLPFVQSDDPVVVYKTLSASDFVL